MIGVYRFGSNPRLEFEPGGVLFGGHRVVVDPASQIFERIQWLAGSLFVSIDDQRFWVIQLPDGRLAAGTSVCHGDLFAVELH